MVSSKMLLALVVLSLLMQFVYCVTEFKSIPTTVKAPENDTVLLPCYLDTSNDGENTPVRVRWYKDGELLIDNGSQKHLSLERFTLWANGSLQVINIEPNDTAEYMCEIVRPYPWSTVKQLHAIEVLRAPSVKPVPSSGILRVKLGEEVRMSCKPAGVPYPIINWYNKGKELKLLDNRETLKFIAYDRQFSGTFTCLARNGVGEPAKADIELVVVYPPELMTPRAWLHSAPGLSARLECEVSADPPATLSWLRKGVPLVMDKRIISLNDGNKYTLIIRNVTETDFGVYTCRGSNSLGQGEIHIQLSGLANPAVFKMADQKNIDTKTAYKMIWQVESYTPIIEYSLWFRPFGLQTSRNREHWKKLNFHESHVSKPDWKKLYIPAESNSGSVHSKLYIIEGLAENTVYEVIVISRNRYGWSKSSNILRFATDGADIKEEIPTQLTVITESEVFSTTLPSVQDNQSVSCVCFTFTVVVNIIFFLQIPILI